MFVCLFVLLHCFHIDFFCIILSFGVLLYTGTNVVTFVMGHSPHTDIFTSVVLHFSESVCGVCMCVYVYIYT